jgi:signal transduction histidine kinase
LAGLRATAEALTDGVLSGPAEVDNAYRTLRRETERLAELVDDLFELAVIQAGALTLHLEQASIGDLVSDALSGASMQARAQGVHLEGRLVGPVPDVLLSPSGLARVLRNLLENAIRHTPHDGTVLVEAGVEGDRAFISVLDGCGGIPEADLRRVFEPAFRGERARTPRDHGGAGLGLAIARGIVEAHAGAMGVSNDGPGCRFVVQLPLRSVDDGRSVRQVINT